MTFEELLEASSKGLPMVEYHSPNYPGVQSGKVTVIKDNSSFKGCAVRLSNNYDEWFYAEPGTDNRKKYMRDLKIIL